MAADRKASNLRTVCHLAYHGQPQAVRVWALTYPTINDHGAAGDFLRPP
jgi:hypothetical protein